VIREIFQGALGAQVSASVPQEPGSYDDFLIKADKNLNTLGATLLGLAGTDAPDAAQILDEALDGNLEVLWVFGHDLVKLFGEENVRELSERVGLFVFSGTNKNPTVPLARWVHRRVVGREERANHGESCERSFLTPRPTPRPGKRD